MITAEEMEREIKDLITECKNLAYVDHPANEKKRKYYDDLLNAILSRFRLLELAEKSKEHFLQFRELAGENRHREANEFYQSYLRLEDDWTSEYEKQRQVTE